jgi:multiple sugar transport system permease protein
MNALHLLATPSYALIVSYLAFTVPFCVWMLKGYFDTIPIELEEAALIDGASRLKALFLIVLPLAAPGLVAAAILTFSLAWNEFLFALVFTSGPKTMTAPVGLQLLASADVFLWDQLMSAAVIMSVPVGVLYVFAQRYVVSGLTAGAVKG